MNIKTIALILGGILFVSVPLVSFADEATSTAHRPFLDARAQFNASSTAPRGRLIGELRQAIGAKFKADIGSLEGAKERALAEIARRVDILTAYIARISGAKKLPDDDKTSLTANLNARLSELAALKLDIENNTSTTTLRADIKSLTDLHKDFKAELPKAALSAASERILSVVSQMEQLSIKLGARIDTAATAGTDVTTLRTDLSDFDASVAAAKVSAQAALDEATALDGSSATASTTIADTRTKIVAGQKSLQNARASAKDIVKALGVSVDASAQASQ